MRTIIACLLFLLAAQTVPAQQKIVLENFRLYNLNGPILRYLQNPDIKQTIATDLNQILGQKMNGQLTNTSDLPIELLDFNFVVPVIKPVFSDSDPNLLHLYLDFIEADPYFFFRYDKESEIDSITQKRVKTVFILKAHIYSSDKKLIQTETLNVLISAAETPGIGNLYNAGIRFTDLTVTSKTFTELFKKGTSILLDTANDLSAIEVKLQPAYLADNYLLPKILNRSRTFVSTQKGISSYQFGRQTEMIRMGEPIYEEILLKGRKAQKYPDLITAAIKATQNFAKSDYVFLQQEGRDVLRDKNYLIKLCTQIDPTDIPADRNLLFTHFLPGNFHYLLQENDTLAKFSILKEVTEKANKIYPNIITNGYDSTGFSTLPNFGNRTAEWVVLYRYVINGSLTGMPFRIKCSGFDNNLREFFLGDQLVCIAQGKFNPEKFVLFDASLSPEKLNQLFLIGFNRFLE
jgi:hypothetical protein